MRKLIYGFIMALLYCSTAQAILISNPNGAPIKTNKTLAQLAVAPEAAGKKIIVDTALNSTFSNISSATLHKWPSDRSLEITKGGSISNTTKFEIDSDLTAGSYQIFAGTGRVMGLRVSRPEWFSGVTYAQINKAIDALPTTGGTVDATGLQGAQTITGQVLVNKNNVTVKFGAATFTLSGITASQSSPATVGQIMTTANNTQFLGNQTKMVFGSGFFPPIMFCSYHGAIGTVIDGFEMDGNKSGVPNAAGNTDDTFASGVNILNASDSAEAPTEQAASIVRNCKIHDFYHYGVTAYGDLSGGGQWINNIVYNNGVVESPQRSTGDGIYINKGTSYQIVQGNRSYGNLRSGINITTAGNAHKGNKILFNYCYSNTRNGIIAEEASDKGSLNAIGQENLLIQGNHCYSNTQSGIVISQTEVAGVKNGYIKNVLLSGNFAYSNGLYGFSIGSTNDATNNVQGVKLIDNIALSNTSYGIGIGTNVLDTTVLQNTSLGNGDGQYLDNGTRTTEAWNKIANSAALSTSSTINAAGISVAGGLVSFEQAGVRSWTIHAAGGNLKIESGDGLGSLTVNGVVK